MKNKIIGILVILLAISLSATIFQSMAVRDLQKENQQLQQYDWDKKLTITGLEWDIERLEDRNAGLVEYQRENPPIDIQLFLYAIENTDNETIIEQLNNLIYNTELLIIEEIIIPTRPPPVNRTRCEGINWADMWIEEKIFIDGNGHIYFESEGDGQ